jgi:hypothetical protein
MSIEGTTVSVEVPTELRRDRKQIARRPPTLWRAGISDITALVVHALGDIGVTEARLQLVRRFAACAFLEIATSPTSGDSSLPCWL